MYCIGKDSLWLVCAGGAGLRAWFGLNPIYGTPSRSQGIHPLAEVDDSSLPSVDEGFVSRSRPWSPQKNTSHFTRFEPVLHAAGPCIGSACPPARSPVARASLPAPR